MKRSKHIDFLFSFLQRKCSQKIQKIRTLDGGYLIVSQIRNEDREHSFEKGLIAIANDVERLNVTFSNSLFQKFYIRT